MQLSLNWLKDYVSIPRSLTPEDLGLKLTTHTVEIDSVEKQAEKYEKIVVGEILEIKKHPNADKLQLAVISVKKGESQEIVCGAPNIKPGQKVPVALLGAVLPNGMEIKSVEIRGIKSNGMLCAEDELGLGEDHAGILILNENAKLGQNLAEYLKLEDVIFEVDNKSITHRPDLWSHYGIGREIAAFLDIKMQKDYKDLKAENMKIKNENTKLDVKVEDQKLCPRYVGIVMDGIKIESSPKWLQERLIAVGLRPICNIVDITNYVMLELGQPMHAFDVAQIATNLDTNSHELKVGTECKIVVRRAKKGEILETLDGEKRKLDEEMLVIADSEKPVAIAGVMGGYNSEISDNTTSIIFESANFDFISIRKTSAKLGLRTDSSMRFEKALDPNLCETAIIRAVELVREICPGARVVSRVVDEKKFELNRGPINLSLGWVKKIIGQEIKDERIISILTSLGFDIERDGDGLKVTVPTWRATRDISIPEDLVEEIARIYGLDNLEPVMPKIQIMTPQKDELKEFIRKAKNVLTGPIKFCEVSNYSFVGEEQIKKIGLDYSGHIRLANPIAGHQTLLRQSLAPNLFNTIKFNQARYSEIKIFEVGSVYLSNIEGNIKKNVGGEENLPYQEKRLAIAIAGSGRDDYFRVLKGYNEYFCSEFGVKITWEPIETPVAWANSKRSAKIKVGGILVGMISELKNEIAKSFGIKKSVVLSEISLEKLLNAISGQSTKKYRPFEKYPPVIRDLAFVVNEKVLYNDIRDEIMNFHEYIKVADLFDVYTGEKLGKSKKNLAFHIIYQADKTFRASEIDEIQKQLIKKLEEKFEARIRDF